MRFHAAFYAVACAITAATSSESPAPTPAIEPVPEPEPVPVPLVDRLMAWMDRVKTYVPAAAASLVAATKGDTPVFVRKNVTALTAENWQELLRPLELEPSAGEPAAEKRAWLVLVTGGNRSCFGQCALLNKAWEDSIDLFSTDPTSPSLGRIDCDQDGILCATWSARPPHIWHIQIPVQEKGLEEGAVEQPATVIRPFRMNTSTVTPADIYSIHADRWVAKAPYTGILHPFDGSIARHGLIVPFGYVMYGFSLVPSWVLMVVVSMLSRTVMGRRVPTAPSQPLTNGRTSH